MLRPRRLSTSVCVTACAAALAIAACERLGADHRSRRLRGRAGDRDRRIIGRGWGDRHRTGRSLGHRRYDRVGRGQGTRHGRRRRDRQRRHRQRRQNRRGGDDRGGRPHRRGRHDWHRGATGAGGATNCAGTLPAGGTVHTSMNLTGGTGALSWSIWTNTAPGTITTFNAPVFSASWNASGDYLARQGFEWGNSGKTFDQFGTITAQFAETKSGSGGSASRTSGSTAGRRTRASSTTSSRTRTTACRSIRAIRPSRARR